MKNIELNLGEAVAELREEIQVQINHVVNLGHDEKSRKEHWLAIRSLQRAEALMREALEIVSC